MVRLRLRKAAILAAASVLLAAIPAFASNTTYQYDPIGRVIQVSYPDGSAITYQYDAAGNRTATQRASSSGGATNPPVANNDSVNAINGVTLAFDPRVNDSDPYGYPLTITALGTPSHGTASFSATSVSYAPSRGYTGADSFSYTISDGHDNSASATITVSITGLLTNGLQSGESQYSSDGRFRATEQTDGNFVLYYGSSALWAANTSGTGANNAIFQSDGNLVVYNGSSAKWTSKTSGHSGATIAIQTDGNMVIYSGSSALWATNTCCH